MAEINMTPFIDVMLVLLIIFMVSAPLLSVGVPIDLPRTQARGIEQNTEPVTVTVDREGKVFLMSGREPVAIADLVVRLRTITTDRRQGPDERIFVRGDRASNYGQIMQVMGQLSAAGFRRVALVTEVEGGR